MLYKPGWSSNELGDMDLFAEGDELHMFFLELPSHDRVGHAVSRDGMQWKLLPHAIHTGDPGEFDDDQIWTMHTFKWQNRYHMLYTALCSAERGRVQRTGLAVSDDLIHWKKVAHNPVAVPDARWYEADVHDSGRADWRDPFPWVEDGRIHALICAHENHGPMNRRGCVAHITSDDAMHWNVEPPLYCTGNNTDFEVPTLIKLNGQYFLLGHHVSPPIDVYRVSDSLLGPWRRPATDWLLPAPNHAFAPAVFHGRTLVVNWVTANIDWPTGTSEGTMRIIVPPKEVVATADGELQLRSYMPGWDAVTIGEGQTITSACTPEHIYRGQWQSQGAAVIGGCGPGMGLLKLDASHPDFILEAMIEFRGAVEAGVVWRSDRTADQCTRVVLTPGRDAVTLQRMTHRQSYNATGRGCDVLQVNQHRYMPDGVHLRIVAWGPYIEVSLDGRVLLSSATMSRRDGMLGLFVEDGEAAFSSMSFRRLNPPTEATPATSTPSSSPQPRTFASGRDDGRFIQTAGFVHRHFLELKPHLAFHPGMSRNQMMSWQQAVRAKLLELMCFPEVPPQPAHKRISGQQREGYRLERWEAYPEPYSVVPYFLLIPDGVSQQSPAPAVLCFPGSTGSKELLAGEPETDNPSAADYSNWSDNRMAYHYARRGLVALAVDSTAMNELASPLRERTAMSMCALWMGRCYEAISVFQKACLLQWIASQPYVDAKRIATSGHSLGAKPADILGVLYPDMVQAVVHNDFVCHWQERAVAENLDAPGAWQIVPGIFQWFDYTDLEASLAPRPLLFTEGGRPNQIARIRKAYAILGAVDAVEVFHHEKYSDRASRRLDNAKLPVGISAEQYFDYAYVDVSDHRFRPNRAVPWLAKVFSI